MFCIPEDYHHVLMYHKFNFVWWSSKHLPTHSPASHFLHLICTRLFIPRAEQVRQYRLEEGNSQWLLKFTSSRVTCFYKTQGLPRVRRGRGSLPALSVKFRTRESRKSLCVILVPHAVNRRKLFRMVMSNKWTNSFFVHFQVRKKRHRRNQDKVSIQQYCLYLAFSALSS
jgi:hypothetical protein